MIQFELIFKGQQYCIEIIVSAHYPADRLLILKNDQVVNETPINYFDDDDTHVTCFNSFDEENDTIEIRDGGRTESRISINLLKEGVRTKLLAEGHTIVINRDRLECGPNYEYAPAVKIKDGNVIQSSCKGQF